MKYLSMLDLSLYYSILEGKNQISYFDNSKCYSSFKLQMTVHGKG